MTRVADSPTSARLSTALVGGALGLAPTLVTLVTCSAFGLATAGAWRQPLLWSVLFAGAVVIAASPTVRAEIASLCSERDPAILHRHGTARAQWHVMILAGLVAAQQAAIAMLALKAPQPAVLLAALCCAGASTIGCMLPVAMLSLGPRQSELSITQRVQASLLSLFLMIGLLIAAGALAPRSPTGGSLLLLGALAGLYALLLGATAARALTRRLQPLLNITARPTRPDNRELEALETGMHDQIGKLTASIAALIGRHRALETELRTSEERFRDFARAASDYFYELDESLYFTYISENLRTLTGFDPAGLIGSSPLDPFPGHREDSDYHGHADDIRQHRPYRNYRYSVTDVMGRTVHTEVSGLPRFDSDGRFLGYRGAGRNITDKVESEQRLHRQEQQLLVAQKLQAVGQLTGGLAHDFNNLLTVIIGNMQLLELRAALDSSARSAVSAALESAQHASKLSRQLLTFARQHPQDRRQIHTDELLLGNKDLMRRTLGENMTLEIDAQADVAPLNADIAQLESALLNLVINARDAMPYGGRLRLVARNANAADFAEVSLAPGRFVVLEVADEGFGMSEETLARVFEPFFSTKSESEGTGLGLSMVWGFAQQSGGSASIASAIGTGTTVRLYLPAAEPLHTTEPQNVDFEGARGSQQCVLVVEDEPAVREVTLRMLEALGYTGIGAATTEEAETTLDERAAIDVLLTDVVLAEPRNGVDLAEAIAARRPELPVVFMTGYAPTEALSDALATGATLLHKPFDDAALAKALAQA